MSNKGAMIAGGLGLLAIVGLVVMGSDDAKASPSHGVPGGTFPDGNDDNLPTSEEEKKGFAKASDELAQEILLMQDIPGILDAREVLAEMRTTAGLPPRDPLVEDHMRIKASELHTQGMNSRDVDDIWNIIVILQGVPNFHVDDLITHADSVAKSEDDSEFMREVEEDPWLDERDL